MDRHWKSSWMSSCKPRLYLVFFLDRLCLHQLFEQINNYQREILYLPHRKKTLWKRNQWSSFKHPGSIHSRCPGIHFGTRYSLLVAYRFIVDSLIDGVLFSSQGVNERGMQAGREDEEWPRTAQRRGSELMCSSGEEPQENATASTAAVGQCYWCVCVHVVCISVCRCVSRLWKARTRQRIEDMCGCLVRS